jgi:Xaa-Pro aminopeptidase
VSAGAGSSAGVPAMPPPPAAELATGGLRARIDRLRAGLAHDGLGAAIASRRSSVRYLAGATADNAVLLVGHDGAWLVIPDGVVDPRSVERLGIEPIVTPSYDAALLVDVEAGVAAAAADLVRRVAPRGLLGVESSHLPVAMVSGSSDRITDLAPTLGRVRAPKDDLEIVGLRRAIAAAERAMAAASTTAVPGATERDLLDSIRTRLIDDVGDDVELACNIATGPRTSLADPHATARTLLEGELVLIDLYPIVEGYAADVTRTFSVGEPPGVWNEREQAVLSALAAGAGALSTGVTGRAVNDAIRERLTEEVGELATTMTHHAGHGIGIAAWERPWIGSRSDDLIEIGDVVCLEPGVYEQQVGGLRVEGEYLVTPAGIERLDHLALGLSSSAS